MLSKEQADTIQNSIWVVNAALKRQGLQYDNDLRQSAILYMCECLQRFDSSRNVKWTTYAYRNVYLYIKREHMASIKQKQYVVVSLDDPLSTPLTEHIMDDDYDSPSAQMMSSIMDICNPEEKEILKLKLAGYNKNEIYNITNYSRRTIWSCIKRVKEKIKQNL